MRYLLPVLILIHITAYADLDADQRHGLKQTKDMLNNPSERQKAIAKDPKAKDMDDKVSALAGTSQNKDEIYGIAAQLMEKIAQETNGDPEKMQLLMLEAQKNPEAFYRSILTTSKKPKFVASPRRSSKSAAAQAGNKLFADDCEFKLVKPDCEPARITGLRSA